MVSLSSGISSVQGFLSQNFLRQEFLGVMGPRHPRVVSIQGRFSPTFCDYFERYSQKIFFSRAQKQLLITSRGYSYFEVIFCLAYLVCWCHSESKDQGEKHEEKGQSYEEKESLEEDDKKKKDSEHMTKEKKRKTENSNESKENES